jgi:hypothetical protein
MTQFLSCSASNDGGCLLFSGADANVLSCFAQGCSALVAASFCSVHITSTSTGTVELNESTSLSGIAAAGTTKIFFDESASVAAVVTSLNSTGNTAQDSGTGLSIGQCYSRSVQFCHFYSNFPTCVLFFNGGGLDTDLFLCLDFFSNSCAGANDNQRGLIALSKDCRFIGCAFVANAIDYLVARSTGSEQPRVVFSYCLFDSENGKSSHNAVVTFEECTTQEASTMWADRLTCPPKTRSPAATASSCFEVSGAFGVSVPLGDSSPIQASFALNSVVLRDSSELQASLVFDDSLLPQDSATLRDSVDIGDSSQIRPSSTLPPTGVFDDGDKGGKPESGPPYLWIGIGAGAGLLVVVSIAIAIALYVRRQRETAAGSEGSDVAPPVEASSWEVNVLPVDECIESFNPLQGSGDGNDSADEFGIASDEQAAV